MRAMEGDDSLKGRLEAAGFPSPAADYLDMGISLDKSLIEHPEATFFFRASGQALEECGVHDGDLLVVDRSVTPGRGHVVVAVVDGEFVVRAFQSLASGSFGEVAIWGVVRWTIHRLCPSL